MPSHRSPLKRNRCLGRSSKDITANIDQVAEYAQVVTACIEPTQLTAGFYSVPMRVTQLTFCNQLIDGLEEKVWLIPTGYRRNALRLNDLSLTDSA